MGLLQAVGDMEGGGEEERSGGAYIYPSRLGLGI